MSSKKHVLSLMETLLSEDGVSIKDAANAIEVSRSKFESLFRRFPERSTEYELEDVIGLISYLIGKNACSVVDAMLLVDYCGLGISGVAKLAELFPFRDLIAVYFSQLASAISTEVDDSDQLRLSVYKDFETFTGSRLIESSDSEETLELLQLSQITRKYLKDTEKSVDYSTKRHAGFLAQLEVIGRDMHSSDFDPLTMAERLSNLKQKSFAPDAKSIQYAVEENESLLLLRSGRLDAARDKLQNLEAAVARIDTEAGTRVEANRGAEKHFAGQYEVAITHYTKAIAQAKTNKNYLVQSFAENGLAGCLTELGQYEDANNHYLNALRYADECGHLERTAYVYANLGILYMYLRDFAHALKFVNVAHRYAVHLNHLELKIQTLLSRGEILTAIGQYDVANEDLQSAKSMAASATNEWLTFEIDLAISRWLLWQDALSDCQSVLSRLIEKACDQSHPMFVLKSIYYYALTLIQESHLDTWQAILQMPIDMDVQHEMRSASSYQWDNLHREAERMIVPVSNDICIELVGQIKSIVSAKEEGGHASPSSL